MRFNEFINRAPNMVDKISNIGVATFKMGDTDKNAARTPHYEIKKCVEMYEKNPIVQSACEQLRLFIIPNKNIKIKSEDPKTQEFLEEWHYLRKGIMDEYSNILLTNLICGNGPMEKHYKVINGKNVLDNVFSYNNMERLYINPDNEPEKKYILKLDVGVNQIYYDGRWQQPTYYQIRYMKNYSWFMDMVYGIYIPQDRISIYRSGWSRDNIYGRSGLASAIDANNILFEILSSWDTITKTRQIDQKLFSIADSESGNTITQSQLDDLAQKLTDSQDSYNIINIPLKNLMEKDIKTSGNYDLLTEVFDILRKMIMMSLLPQHLTPWSDSSTTQGSEAAMPPFLSRVKAKQNEFINYLNSEVIDELRKSYPWLAEDATFVFDEPNIVGYDHYVTMMNNLIGTGVITAAEARQYLLKIGVLDEDFLEEKKITKQKALLTEKMSGLGEITFQDFKKKLKEAEIDISNIREIEYKNIGGKSVRLIKNDDQYLIYDGINPVSTFNDDISLIKIKDIYKDYCAKVKEKQDEFETEQDNELIIIDEAKKELQKIIEDRLDEFLNKITKTQIKKEGFLSTKIFDKLDDVFAGLMPNLNSVVSKTLNKLGIQVVDIKGSDDKTKDLLYDKKDLLIKNMQDQIKTTKDEMLQDIKRTLADGIAAGKTPQQIKSEIKQSYNYENGIGWKFDRAFFTFARQSAGILKLRKWKEMGLKEFEWKSMGDSKVRPEHQEYNGKVFKIDDALSGKIPFPGGSLVAGKPNINCRCKAIPYS